MTCIVLTVAGRRDELGWDGRPGTGGVRAIEGRREEGQQEGSQVFSDGPHTGNMPIVFGTWDAGCGMRNAGI